MGTNLCRQLSRKQQDFEIIDLKMSNQFPEKCKIADVRDVESLRAAMTGDVVVNLAAVHRDDVRDKSEYQRTNVDGAENVAQLCTEKGIKKIVFTSTVAVYGFAEPGTDEAGGCCQTNENSHRIAGAALIYALNSWRHSVRAAVRLSLKLSRE